MHLIKRETCAITHTRDLEDLYTFKEFPVFMGCSSKPENHDLKADMAWSISKSSGLIQLKYLLPLDILYPESHGAGCVGALWNKHHKAFAAYLHQFNLSSVFEIGGSHGILAKEYSEFSDIPWTILEPNPSPVAGVKARFIKGFFDNRFQYADSFDAIVHSHVFEHIYDPDAFMSYVSNFMEEGKYLIFSIPNMQVMLERKYTNCINFEHTVFITEDDIDYLLSRHGFRLLKKEYFGEDHSIFYAALRDKSVKPQALNPGLYEKNKKVYQDYVEHHENLITALNSQMRGVNQPVYLFGAHIFAQSLIAFGLDTSRIVCLLDNDPNKQGKRLYGTSLFVNSPKVLKEVDRPVVILKAGVYNNEIKEDILSNINSSVIFWE